MQVAKTGQATQTYAYDGQGRRIAKGVGSTVTEYLYNGSDLLAEYGGSGANWTTAAATATYTHGPRIDEPLLRTTATGTQYYHQDGLGSVVAMSDAGGITTGTAHYDAWGNAVATIGTVPQYGYTGREPDETGLIYYRARYYDPAIGRFTQRDPIGLQGGMNPYAYVNNNPINLVDPKGELAFVWHFMISASAANLSGYGLIDSLKIGYYAAAQDFQPAAHGTSADDTAQHGGMIGEISPGYSETAEQAIQRSEQFIAENSTNPQDLEALGRALHSAQDLAASWHAGESWPPEHTSTADEVLKEIGHYARDSVPIGAFGGAAENSARVLSDARLLGTQELAPYTGCGTPTVGQSK